MGPIRSSRPVPGGGPDALGAGEPSVCEHTQKETGGLLRVTAFGQGG